MNLETRVDDTEFHVSRGKYSLDGEDQQKTQAYQPRETEEVIYLPFVPSMKSFTSLSTIKRINHLTQAVITLVLRYCYTCNDRVY
jgi:hypothetical protein